MSILKVDELQSRTSGNRITLPEVNNYPPYRNIIINGNMSIAQRNTSETGITAGGYYTVDRYDIGGTTFGTFTQSQDTDVPTGQGFTNSIKFLCTTANASLSANSFLQMHQSIEGQNLQYIKKGTSNAESTTLSFWVKSNKTGTYIVQLYDIDNTRMISKSYTINSANTWEKKTITYDGDTTGTLDNDNERSLDLLFGLCSGTNNSSGTLQTTWGTAVSANRFVGQVNLADAINNYWQITGVQLEVGDSATPFEHLPYDVNLQRCQRYYQRIAGYSADQTAIGMGYAIGTTQVRIYLPLITTMRVVPAIGENLVETLFGTGASLADISLNSTLDEGLNTYGITFTADTGSPFTSNNPVLVRLKNDVDAYLEFGAEL